MDSDEFYLDPSSFDDDSQLSLIDEEKLKVLAKIKEYATLTEDCVRFQEKDDYEINFRILSRYISAMADLSMLDSGELTYTDEDGNRCTHRLTEDEIIDAIKDIDLGVVDITHSILENISNDSDADEKVSLDDIVIKNKKNSDDDGSLDF